MDSNLPTSTQYLVFGTIALSILLGVMNNKATAPQLGIFNRWARWFSVSLGGAFVVFESDWTSRPFWAVAVIIFLFWLLIETAYNWFAISALSQSTFSLFPRFRENDSGEEWPASKKMIELREWLKSNGFKRAQALVSDVGNGIFIRSSIYENEPKTIRAQVLFIPQSNGTIGYCLSFSSEELNGDRKITDNMFMPYGGFYPENWDVRRLPWRRGAATLLKFHNKRIQNLELEAYDSAPMDDLNQQQGLLERTNIEAGFLFPPHMQEELGRITWDGRYRVWKEVWLLNYFGKSTRS